MPLLSFPHLVYSLNKSEVILPVELIVPPGQPGGQREGVVEECLVEEGEEGGGCSQTQPGEGEAEEIKSTTGNSLSLCLSLSLSPSLPPSLSLSLSLSLSVVPLFLHFTTRKVHTYNI